MLPTDLSREKIKRFKDGATLYRCTLPDTLIEYSYIEDITGFELGSRPTREEEKLVKWYEEYLENTETRISDYYDKRIKQILTDDVFNKLKWKQVDALDLPAMVEGLKVIASEPTDYPNTDALTIYLEDSNGNRKALDISYNEELLEDREQQTYIGIRIADIPA